MRASTPKKGLEAQSKQEATQKEQPLSGPLTLLFKLHRLALGFYLKLYQHV